MKLLDRNGYAVDRYTKLTSDDIPTDVLLLVPLDRIGEALSKNIEKPGIEFTTATKFTDVEPFIDDVSLISVVISGFADGRCYSLAKRIRRAGFKGRLRITGPVIADQFPYALACGVDEIALPDDSADRQPVEQWQQAALQITNTYQLGYAREGNILEQRRAARNAQVKAAAHG